MEGTGGVRKLRWSRGSQGKSGGVRVIYYYHDARMPLYLLALFAKGQGQSNQGRAQRSGRFGRHSGEHLERKDSMTTAFESIKQALQEAIAHAKGEAPEVRVHYPRVVDVKAVRAKVGMTQEQFAARFGFSTATLRHWERGDRTPRGPALVLLNVIERNPQAVIAALA